MHIILYRIHYFIEVPLNNFVSQGNPVVKISQLPQLQSPTSADEFPIVSAGTTWKLPLSVLDSRYSSGINNSVFSNATLATIPTTIISSLPYSILFVNTVDIGFNVLVGWQLVSSEAGTVQNVTQRPNDFDAFSNAKVWFKVL